MAKKLFIAEKPSVAQQFAEALKIKGARKDGYLEDENYIVTWCVGHLVGMSYPDAYDSALKKWSMDTIPFIPEKYKYEVIPAVSKQFKIVSGLLNRDDVETIYVCTDSGREGEYIYRLVDNQAKVPDSKDKRRVWIDSQTEEEILRGIRSLWEFNLLLTLPGHLGYRRVDRLLQKLPSYSFIHGHMINLDPNPLCDRSNQDLRQKYEDAIRDAALLIREFLPAVRGQKEWSSLMDYDFESVDTDIAKGCRPGS